MSRLITKYISVWIYDKKKEDWIKINHEKDFVGIYEIGINKDGDDFLTFLIYRRFFFNLFVRKEWYYDSSFLIQEHDQFVCDK